MVHDSGAERGRYRRNSASIMPVIVARAAQSRQKREIALRQRSPGVAVHDRPYPSVAVCRRFPVFAAASTLASGVGGNALAR